MPQDDFYTKMRAGLSALLRQWRSLGQADADQLALILAETARVAKLGTPDATPSGATLEQWSQDQQGEMPLWAPRTAVFLLNQMPPGLPHKAMKKPAPGRTAGCVTARLIRWTQPAPPCLPT